MQGLMEPAQPAPQQAGEPAVEAQRQLLAAEAERQRLAAAERKRQAELLQKKRNAQAEQAMAEWNQEPTESDFFFALQTGSAGLPPLLQKTQKEGPKKESPEVQALRRQLEKLRLELYKAQVDMKEIGAAFQSLSNMHNNVVDNIEKIQDEAPEDIYDVASAWRSIRLDRFLEESKKLNSTADLLRKQQTAQRELDEFNGISIGKDLKSFSEIAKLKTGKEYLEQGWEYAAQVGKVLPVVDAGLKGAKGWANVYKENQWIEGEPERFLRFRALKNDAAATESRVREVTGKIQSTRDAIARLTKTPADQIDTSPLAPPFDKPYVPPTFPRNFRQMP